MKYVGYLKQTWPDMLLSCVAACAMGLQIVQCFHIADALAENVVLVAIITVIPLLGLFALAYNTRTVVVGIPVFALIVVTFFIVLSNNAATPLFSDTYENGALLYVVLLPTSVVLFALTRKRAGVAVAFVVGAIVCGAVQFLYLKNLVAPTAVYLVSCGALYLVKGKAGVRGDVGSLRLQASKLGMGVGLCAVSALAAFGLFVLAIAPLNPPAHELKLVTEYYSLEEVRVTGLVDWLHLTNPFAGSRNEDDRTRQTGSVDEREQESQGQDGARQGAGEAELAGGSMLPDVAGAAADIIRYFQEHWWLAPLLIGLAMVLWALIVIVRHALRKQRLNRWKKLAVESEVQELYGYACASMERAQVLTRSSHTPLSLAHSANDQTARFEKTGDTCTFSEFSETFSRVTYGATPLTEAELSAMRAYAQRVPVRIMHYVGRARYLRLFFRV